MAYPEFSTKCSETQQRFLHYGLKICQMQNQNQLIVEKRLKSTYPATYCWALGLVMNSNSERTGVPIIYDKDHEKSNYHVENMSESNDFGQICNGDTSWILEIWSR